jgi:tripartite ATP-independent transporter DctP family solute receptor
MGAKLQAATGGRLRIQIYPSMQLGGEKELIEQTRAGTIQIARVSNGLMGQIVPELDVLNLPYMFRNAVHIEKLMDGPIGDELLKKITDSPRSDLVGLGWMSAGTRNIYNNKHPIRTLSDLRGLKIRVIPNSVFVDTVESLGGVGVGLGYDRLVDAFKSGMVDGAENNEPSYEAGEHFRFARYYSLTGHLTMPELLVYSRRAWLTLSDGDRALIIKLAKEAQQEERSLWADMEKRSLERMQREGVEINDVSDRKPFAVAVQPVWQWHAAQYLFLIQRIQAIK